MQYSWSVLIVTISVLGIAGSILMRAAHQPRMLGLLCALVACASILVVVGHNFYWEWFLNNNASRGWTLFYTLPTAGISLLTTLLTCLGIVFIRFKHKNQ